VSVLRGSCDREESGDILQETYQLRSQFVAVVMESALARTLRGKISPVTTQAIGP
jgi:hypothetical protein